MTSLGKKTYKTRVIRHSLNPVYEEKLVFQVLRHETQYSLSFTVMDRDKLSGNDLVATCNFPVDKVASLAPKSDPDTGLFVVKEPEPFGSPMTEAKKSRFRVPLSRSSSTASLQKVNSNLGKSGLTRSDSSTSLTNSSKFHDRSSFSKSQDSSKPNSGMTSDSLGTDEVPKGSSFDVGNPDDPDLRPFVLPLIMKHKDKWEDRHQPRVHIRAKYLPYKALRQQFWRAMLKQYDADDSGSISQVELTTMLDSLGSTLHEKTIDDMFAKFQDASKGPEPALTTDQAVMCLEELLERLEQKKRPWHSARPRRSSSHEDQSDESSTPSSSEDQSPTEDSPSIETGSKSIRVSRLRHPHHGTSGENGDGYNADSLHDGELDSEEHIVEIRECPICHQPRMTRKSDSDIITHIATCASQDWRQVNNIMMAGFVTSSQAQRKWYSKVVSRIGYGGYKLGKNSANILVQDRVTGQINEERMSVYVRLGIRLMYKGLKSNTMEKGRSKLTVVS